ncbi:hypothetical protein SAY86_031625 [Trapa natans]|uniref:Uncharacterized protein n=1 Tax=Trapa natans TaxID=22666 RepID=A0AAN7M3J6_TRANT|nr:hypothetical protein SAY86_031625 [Trapa natans]
MTTTEAPPAFLTYLKENSTELRGRATIDLQLRKRSNCPSYLLDANARRISKGHVFTRNRKATEGRDDPRGGELGEEFNVGREGSWGSEGSRLHSLNLYSSGRLGEEGTGKNGKIMTGREEKAMPF